MVTQLHKQMIGALVRILTPAATICTKTHCEERFIAQFLCLGTVVKQCFGGSASTEPTMEVPVIMG